MKTFSVATALALVATLAHAAPSSAPVEARQVPYASLTFQGAGSNPPSYYIGQPADGSIFTIDNPLSVSHIILGPGGYKLAGCVLYGADGSVTSVADASSADVGPPQPQVSGTCFSFQ